jgi:hypothetical protein
LQLLQYTPQQHRGFAGSGEVNRQATDTRAFFEDGLDGGVVFSTAALRQYYNSYNIKFSTTPSPKPELQLLMIYNRTFGTFNIASVAIMASPTSSRSCV